VQYIYNGIMENKELSQEESLKVIDDMIHLAKNKITETGFHFLLWGILCILASLSQYVLIVQGMVSQSGLVWGVMTVIGVPIAIFYERNNHRKKQVSTKFDKIYGYLWLGFGITMFITIYLSAALNVYPISFILVLVGLATFVSGAINNFRPLIIGAVVFWLAAVLCPLLDGKMQLLVNALAIFIGYIIPGLLLRRKAKNS